MAVPARSIVLRHKDSKLQVRVEISPSTSGKFLHLFMREEYMDGITTNNVVGVWLTGAGLENLEEFIRGCRHEMTDS